MQGFLAHVSKNSSLCTHNAQTVFFLFLTLKPCSLDPKRTQKLVANFNPASEVIMESTGKGNHYMIRPRKVTLLKNSSNSNCYFHSVILNLFLSIPSYDLTRNANDSSFPPFNLPCFFFVLFFSEII